jgi:hypothetical protein
MKIGMRLLAEVTFYKNNWILAGLDFRIFFFLHDLSKAPFEAFLIVFVIIIAILYCNGRDEMVFSIIFAIPSRKNWLGLVWF